MPIDPIGGSTPPYNPYSVPAGEAASVQKGADPAKVGPLGCET